MRQQYGVLLCPKLKGVKVVDVNLMAIIIHFPIQSDRLLGKIQLNGQEDTFSVTHIISLC